MFQCITRTTWIVHWENVSEVGSKWYFSSSWTCSCISFGKCVLCTFRHLDATILLHGNDTHTFNALYCELNDKYSHLIGFSFPLFHSMFIFCCCSISVFCFACTFRWIQPSLFSGKFEWFMKLACAKRTHTAHIFLYAIRL